MSGTKFCYERAQDNCYRFQHALPHSHGIKDGGNQRSIADCQNRCSVVEGCVWFTYIPQWTNRQKTQNCFLKSEFSEEEVYENAIYGSKICTGKKLIDL